MDDYPIIAQTTSGWVIEAAPRMYLCVGGSLVKPEDMARLKIPKGTKGSYYHLTRFDAVIALETHLCQCGDKVWTNI